MLPSARRKLPSAGTAEEAMAAPPLPIEPVGWPRRSGIDRIIGTSAATHRLRETVRKVARSQAMTILLQGESGTGKDLVAQALHEESARAETPYVPINCSAIPESLMEAEFFGHEPGAYTDAKERKLGLFELAHTGSALLDEVAEFPLGVQAKFLRFLEERRFRRLGGTADIDVDVRILAGTNVDLTEAVRLGRFRADLYYRLRVVPIAVLPLRERPEDIPPLARFFLDHYSRRLRKRFEEFAPESMHRLVLHPWPGNVRELKNAIERVVLLEEGPTVRPEMLVLGEGAATAPLRATGSEELRFEQLELRALVRALELSQGNLSGAARMLGVSRDTVRYRMEKHAIRIEARVVVGPPPGETRRTPGAPAA
jgi:two-component system response regulator AtoC